MVSNPPSSGAAPNPSRILRPVFLAVGIEAHCLSSPFAQLLCRQLLPSRPTAMPGSLIHLVCVSAILRTTPHHTTARLVMDRSQRRSKPHNDCECACPWGCLGDAAWFERTTAEACCGAMMESDRSAVSGLWLFHAVPCCNPPLLRTPVIGVSLALASWPRRSAMQVRPESGFYPHSAGLPDR